MTRTLSDIRTFRPTYETTFANLDGWTAMSGATPGVGSYDPDYAVPGATGLTLHVTQTGSAGNSAGSGVMTADSYGYGLWDFDARIATDAADVASAGSPVAGQTSVIDLYSVAGEDRRITAADYACPRVFGDIASRLVNFAILWEPASIRFYVDGLLVFSQTAAVPSTPRQPVLACVPTSPATLNTTRRLFVTRARFWDRDDWTGG